MKNLIHNKNKISGIILSLFLSFLLLFSAVFVNVGLVKEASAVSVKNTVSTKKVKKMKVATPKISGTLQVGKTLIVKKLFWASKAKYHFQWYRNGKKIKKATKSKYKLTKADQGKKISVKVTGKKSGYKTVSKNSSKTRKIKKAPTKKKAVAKGKKYTISPSTCKNAFKSQSCVNSKTFSYIDYRQWGGPQWIGGHQRGKAKIILNFKKGDIITIKGTKAAGKYKITGSKTIKWRRGIKPTSLGKGYVFQTCTKNGKNLKIVYAKKIK